MNIREGRRRVVIEGVRPEIDGGRFPVKRTLGERVVVEADVFADGHDLVACALRYRHEADAGWTDVPMAFVENDRWRGAFAVDRLGRYGYTVRGWIDRFATWRRDLERKVEAEQDVAVELLAGAELIERASRRATGGQARLLRDAAALLRSGPSDEAVADALSEELRGTMGRYPDQRLATSFGRELEVVVDRERAGFGAWYELFPRSASVEPGRHGTLKDVEARLPYVASMGFDVLYLPPVHPIGHTFRKGANNRPGGRAGSPGSPWAIGSEAGGHSSIDPNLGTIEDFDRLVGAAGDLGLEIALDLAFQCSPDHPWVREHPAWFRHRPDGTVQYAENPPKKYQDIYPLDFETAEWWELWQELERVVLFWIGHGVRIFRVDNPHTKPFHFWEWLISEVKTRYPDVIFLSEAFTRPKVMYRLAKLGFTQSYTYFAWRNTRWELAEYFAELTREPVREFFRPNLWPNTPDILTEHLQTGGRPAFVARLVLAATLGANYGIYGPPFELMQDRPLARGSEEYLDSEKYQVRHWDIDREDSLSELIARVNRIRRENPALHGDRSLRFHHTDNEQLIAYSKRSEEGSNVVLAVVNLDPFHTQAGWTNLDLEALGVRDDRPFQVLDLLTGSRYAWRGRHNYVELNPAVVPVHVLLVRPPDRTERDFETFM